MKIGIRREDKSPWEFRVPVIPEHVMELSDAHGLRFCVQPSENRIYGDEEFVECGAEITLDLHACPIVVGVKEIPLDKFEKGKTYVFFAHVIKGQAYNMPMLRRMMELGCSLIDYEMIVDDAGHRLVFFGRYAGLAGMIDSLWSLGQRLKVEGNVTPLAELNPAHEYESLKAAKEHLAEVATEIASGDGLKGCGPIVCGFAGYGSVSKGAQEIYGFFAPAELSPNELAGIDANEGDGQFYKVVFKEEHMVEPVDRTARFDLQDYYTHPHRYRPTFEQYLAHLTLLINCIYWEPKYPRLVTAEAMRRLYGGGATPRLKVIGDISCDPGGSVECMSKATDPGNPVYVYDVATMRPIDGFTGHGPVIMAVEILPSELPRESSAEFSHALLGLLPGLAKSDPSGGFEAWELPAPLKRAVILHKGRLTEKFAYIGQYVD